MNADEHYLTQQIYQSDPFPFRGVQLVLLILLHIISRIKSEESSFSNLNALNKYCGSSARQGQTIDTILQDYQIVNTLIFLNTCKTLFFKIYLDI